MTPQRDYFTCALADARVIELRHQDGGRWTSGTFDDPLALRQAISTLAERGNLYTSLNAPGDVHVTNAMTGRALRGEDIVCVTRLPFDHDPVRPTGMPSTDAELAAAVAARNRLVSTLCGLGFPQPAVAISGNGAHAVYRVRMKATDTVSDMLGVVYRGLKDDFSTPDVSFDPTVRNPARIWRCYGAPNRKGTPTPDRPHRMAQVVVPQRWEGVDPRQIEALANRYARRGQAKRRHDVEHRADAVVGSGDYSTLDAIAWFTAHGLYKRPLGGGKHAVTCPWYNEHSTPDMPHGTDTVIFEPNGAWAGFHCSHQHCDGRSLRDVLRLFGDADRFCARAFQRGARMTTYDLIRSIGGSAGGVAGSGRADRQLARACGDTRSVEPKGGKASWVQTRRSCARCDALERLRRVCQGVGHVGVPATAGSCRLRAHCTRRAVSESH